MEQNVRPVAFLMYDTGKITCVVVPWRRWFAREALNTTESCVL